MSYKISNKLVKLTSKALGINSMEVRREAKLVDIKILEVPYSWEGEVPTNEIGSPDNDSIIKMVHIPSGIEFQVKVNPSIDRRKHIAREQAKAKLIFIHQLHGDSLLIDQIFPGGNNA